MDYRYRMENLETGEVYVFPAWWTLKRIGAFYRKAVLSMRCHGFSRPRIWVEDENGMLVYGTRY